MVFRSEHLAGKLGLSNSTAGLVLVSDLDISVQVVGNRVRVYAEDRATGKPVKDVFIKIADGKEIKAQGFTDARGVFEGRGISGAVMVVAEKEGDEYVIKGQKAAWVSNATIADIAVRAPTRSIQRPTSTSRPAPTSVPMR